MKISQRIIVINFAIVVLILGAVGFVFFTTLFNIFKEQQEKQLLNAANDFLFNLQMEIEKTDDAFKVIQPQIDKTLNEGFKPDTDNLSFVFKVTNDSLIFPENRLSRGLIIFPEGVVTLSEFFNTNPNIIVKRYRAPSGREYFYGLQLSHSLLNEISRRIKTDIAIFVEGNLYGLSNETETQDYYYLLLNAFKDLRSKGNFSIISTETEDSYLVATVYTLIGYFQVGERIDILIFSTRDDAIQLRDTISVIILIIAIAGIILSFILTVLFTSKIRKQISRLSKATDITRSGDFQTRIEVEEKNELGELAQAFNRMLDELEKRDRVQQEYLAFLALINQSPTLKELGNSVLEGIVQATGFTIGAIYLIDEEGIEQVCAYGLEQETTETEKKKSALRYVADSEEPMEMHFEQNAPTISFGLVDIKIGYMLILPVIFNAKVIALLELGAVSAPVEDAKQYLKKIEQQLAIGLANAIAFAKSENLIKDLQQLNEEYQKQNEQIKEQNRNLLLLHRELKEKAEELEIQKQKAEESTTLKTRFLALISHELKTPLNAILGLTELVVNDKSIRRKNRDRLEVVLKSGRRLLNLINDILDISKIEAGKMEIREVSFRINVLIDEVAEQIHPLAEEKGLQFQLENNLERNYTIITDKAKIAQILLNLLGNAVKFTETGFIRLFISDNSKNFLIFEVTDSGIGISEAEQKQIFEEFRQADSSSRRKYSGTGLGLAISKKFAELLNGRISLQSDEKDGTVFRVEIPVTFVDDASSENISSFNKPEKEYDIIQTNFDESEEQETSSKQGIVMIVDDDPDTLFTLNEIVQEEGFNTAMARNGAECLELLKKSKKPDVILLDIMMPVMNGFETIQHIRKEFSQDDIPVLAVTARAMLDDSETIYKYGFNDLIPKPIDGKELIKYLYRYTSNDIERDK